MDSRKRQKSRSVLARFAVQRKEKFLFLHDPSLGFIYDIFQISDSIFLKKNDKIKCFLYVPGLQMQKGGSTLKTKLRVVGDYQLQSSLEFHQIMTGFFCFLFFTILSFVGHLQVWVRHNHTNNVPLQCSATNISCAPSVTRLKKICTLCETIKEV